MKMNNMNDLIRRQSVIDLLEEWGGGYAYIEVETDGAIEAINALPSEQTEDVIHITGRRKFVSEFDFDEPEQTRMSNKEWIDFLSEQFNVSRTSARGMLHGLIKCKAEDNFKKQFSGGNNGSIH